MTICVGLGVGCAYEPIVSSSDVPLLPSLPDPGRIHACAACAKQKCSLPRAACLEDDGCRELLQCKGRCTDPTCLQTCTAEHGFSPWYDDLWACVLTNECSGPCMPGANFACVDSYRAPRADNDAQRFPVRFHYKNPRTGIAYAYPGDQRDEEFAVGALARSCASSATALSECQIIDSGTVDATDTVQLDVTVQQVTRRYAGTIEVELPDLSQAAPDRFRQLGMRDRYMPPFLGRATELRFYVFWRQWIRDHVFERSGTVLDFRTAAPLAIYLEDCMGAPARDIRFELPHQGGIDVLHQVSDGSTSDATDTGSAMVGDIPESNRNDAIVVQAVRVGTGEVVAARTDVYVRAGWTTHVWLMPRASP